MNQQTHTPGKLVFEYGSLYLDDLGARQRQPGETSVCIAKMDRNEPHTSPTERDANAARLALAWNMHSELVKCLRDLVAPYDQNIDGAPTAIKLARAALSRVEVVK